MSDGEKTEEQTVLYDLEDGIGVITLNRPKQLNAVTDDLLVEMTNLINEVTVDDAVRAVIITGSGRAFCSGADVTQGLLRDQAAAAVVRDAKIKKVDIPDSPLPKWTFTQIPKPTIAAVNGAAVGIGAEWTAQCDMRIASEKARFGWVFALRGISPDTGAGPLLLPYIVGLSKALELMYSGEIIDAVEAERIGLVSKVVPQDELLTSAKELAQKITRGAPLATKAVKELTYGAMEWPNEVLQKEKTERLSALSLSEDTKEGIKSFLEKRPPVWQGR